MAVCYVRMGGWIAASNFCLFNLKYLGKNLWRDAPGELTESTVKCRKNKRKIIKMFVVIISVFGVCWLPYHVYFIYSYHQPSIMALPYIKHVYLGFYWLAMANCAVNPIIYYWMGNRFRKYFNQLLRCDCLRVSQDSLEVLHLTTASPQSRRTRSFQVRPDIDRSQSED